MHWAQLAAQGEHRLLEAKWPVGHWLRHWRWSRNLEPEQEVQLSEVVEQLAQLPSQGEQLLSRSGSNAPGQLEKQLPEERK